MEYNYDSVSHDEMNQLLLEWSGTRHYLAVLKYLYARQSQAIAALCTLDPFKDPAGLARNQGTISGLLDIVKAVDILQEDAKKVEAEAKENATNG